MHIEIDDATVLQQASIAGFETVQDYIADLLHRDAERQADIRAALDESSADIAAGRTRPLAEAMTEIRTKHDLSR